LPRLAATRAGIGIRLRISMGLANWLTIVRILLVPVLVICLVYNRALLALGTFVVAAVTDMMDGYIARTRGTKTRLGAFLDPLADKLLLTASFVTLTYKFPQVLPFWLTAIVLSRDILLVLVAVLIMLTGGQLNPTPTWLGKASTVFQMITVGVALLVVGSGHDFWLLRKGLFALAAALTVGSGIQYLALAPRYVDWGGR
jgi:cardiolipin synthase